MTAASAPRPGRGPASDRSDLSGEPLRSDHVVKFLSCCVAAAAALALPACAKKADHTSAPEADAGGAQPDDITTLERELAAREQQLAAVWPAPTVAGAAGGGGQAARTRADENHLEKKGAQAGGDATEAPVSAPAPTSATPESMPSRDVPGDRCMTVCELSAAICQLQDRICDLAPRHPDEPRYQAACQRAARDCETSREACHGCT